MNDRRIGRVEDCTTAFLGMTYLLVVLSLTLVWGAWGYGVALGACLVLHLAIRRLGRVRAAREAEWDARVEAALSRARASDARAGGVDGSVRRRR